MLTAAGHRAVLGAMVFLTAGALVIAVQDDDGSTVTAGDPAASVTSSGTIPEGAAEGTAEPAPSTPAPSGVPSTTAPSTTLPPEVSVPVGAVGAYTAAAGESEGVGTGALTTYSVEVEDALGYSADEFARIVDAALSDARSWTADGSVAFQRVASGASVRIVLATPATVDQLCLPLQTNGIFSCHQGGTVALNSLRWMNGTEDWPGTVDEYRSYVVNHEVGHAIGHGHVDCPGPGEPAPVMMQQSKGLDGCLPNGWPFP